MRLATLLMLFLMTLMLATPATAQKLYRWVDTDGNVHYSDQVPPDQIDQARDELNDEGRVVGSVEQAPSALELEALGEEERRAHAEQLRQAQQMVEDQKIEAVYAGEQGLINKRERILAGFNLRIRNAQEFILSQADSLDNMSKRKTIIEADGSKVSAAFQSMLDDLERQVNQQQTLLDAKIIERDEIIEFYDKELSNYRAMLKRKALRDPAPE